MIQQKQGNSDIRQIFTKSSSYYHSNDKLLKYYLYKERNPNKGKSDIQQIHQLNKKVNMLQKYEGQYQRIKRENYLLKEQLRVLKIYNEENIRLIGNFKVLLNQKNNALKIENSQQQDKLSKKLKLKCIQIDHLKKFNFFLSQWNSWASGQLQKYRKQTQNTKIDMQKVRQKLGQQPDQKKQVDFQKVELRSQVVKMRYLLKQKQQQCVENEKKYLQCQKQLTLQFLKIHEQIRSLQFSFDNLIKKIEKMDEQMKAEDRQSEQRVDELGMSDIQNCVLKLDERFNLISKLKARDQRSSYQKYVLMDKFNEYQSKIKKYQQQNIFIDRKNKQLEHTLAEKDYLVQQIQKYKKQYQMQFYGLTSLLQKKKQQFKNLTNTIILQTKNINACPKCSPLQTVFVQSIILFKQQYQKIHQIVQLVFQKFFTNR